MRPAPDQSRLRVLVGLPGWTPRRSAAAGPAVARLRASMRRESAALLRRALAPRDVEREMRRVWFDRSLAPGLREEAPSAYKDVDAVMRAQSDLVRIVRRLRPLLVFKGT